MDVPNKRNYVIDNLRAFLIICVVAGHLLETLSFSGSRRLYVLIYSFHMPAFVFVSGMCCKMNGNTPKRLLKRYVYSYLIFQTLYLLFSNHILNISVEYQYMTPYWLLWYLLSMIWWHGMISIYSVLTNKVLAVGISMIFSLMIGFDSSIGYYASFSRTFVLFPFFLGGYYAKNLPFFSDPDWYQKREARLFGVQRLIVAITGMILAALILIYASRIDNKMIYHSFAYDMERFHWICRMVMLAIAWVWIIILFAIIPRCKILWFTYCGQNTMSVFLWHGFIMKYLALHIGEWHLTSHVIPFLVWTILIPILLSSKPVLVFSKPFLCFYQKR